jgi:hypothetical protein
MNAIVPVMDLNDLLEDNNTGNNVVTNNFSNCLGTDNGGWPIVNETVSSGSHHLTTSSNYVNWSMGQFSPRAWQ